MRRFLDRVYRIFDDESMKAKWTNTNDGSLDFAYHSMVKKVTTDFEALQFNTAISAMMIFVNEVYKAKTLYVPYLEGFLKAFACIAPHLGEEIWQKMGHEDVIDFEPWPTYDEDKLVKKEVEIAIQVNGKLRSTMHIHVDATKEEVEEVALNDETIKRHLEGKTIRKIIVVPNKICNIVAN